MKRNLIALIFAASMFTGVSFALAQDTTTPTPEGNPVADVTVIPDAPPAEATEVIPVEPPTPVLPPDTQSPGDILGIVLAALLAGSATVGGSIVVTAVVGVLKMVVPATLASSDTIKNIVSVVVWVGYSVAIKFGLGTQFQNIATFLVPILVTATPLIGVLIGSSKLYLASRAANVPIMGYKRP